ncbi:hypothetical protein NQP46_20520 [Streptomyces albus]|nr:hypothetical protein NQP46_20520 [Streptomyces albus]
MPDVVVSTAELGQRTVRRSDFVSCNQAFIDCRTPGSDRKENYAMIGPGVSQSSGQFVNLRLPHGYNIGAAAMPHGITNNLHLHYTAEVFVCTAGEYLLRWGADGTEGELLLKAGDIASVPTWIFRGSPTPARTTAGCSPCSAWTTPAASSGAPRSCVRPNSTACT